MSPVLVVLLMWTFIGICSGFLVGWVFGRMWRGIDGRVRMATRRGVVVLEPSK